MALIVETSAGQLFKVEPSVLFDHAWVGIAVRKSDHEPKANAKTMLVRKAGCRIVASA